MAMWGAKRRQIECYRDFIVERLLAGQSLPEIHSELMANGDLTIALTTFRRYTSPIRNSLKDEQINGRGQPTATPSAAPKVLTPDFSPKNTKPSSKKAPPLPNPALAQKFVSTGTGSTKSAFTIVDAYGADSGEDADDS